MKITFPDASIREWAVICTDFCDAYGRDVDVLCLGNVLKSPNLCFFKMIYLLIATKSFLVN